MDPRTNPYAPGAGTPPPQLAGRDQSIEDAAIALDRIRAGRSAKSFIFHGLRGVGKTVLLNHIRKQAASRGIACVPIEAPEGRSLPATLIPATRTALLELRPGHEKFIDGALGVLAAFANAMKVKYGDVEFGSRVAVAHGIADSGDLEADLSALIQTIGEAAQKRSTAVVFFVDELQYVAKDQLGALITALHHANQNQVPVTMLGAGLPQLVGRTGEAKSYAERLFRFVEIGSLDPASAKEALVLPAEEQDVSFDPAAVAKVLEKTECYPYFLQVWGQHCWAHAPASPIDLAAANNATLSALSELDGGFFRVRLDRCTPAEKRYLYAMACIGPGPHRSGQVADELGVKVNSAAPTRSHLIQKGMIYSPAHGDTAFTVPLFDQFIRRTMSPDI